MGSNGRGRNQSGKDGQNKKKVERGGRWAGWSDQNDISGDVLVFPVFERDWVQILYFFPVHR